MARAVSAACAAFAGTGGDLRLHTVDVLLDPSHCEVIFVPVPVGAGAPRGGRTEAGREIHYRVALDTGEIESTRYAR